MHAPSSEPSGPSFVSLGMVVLDELRFANSPTLHDVIGGSGAYSVLGARLASGRADRKCVGCCVIAGHDFPQPATSTFQSWGVQLCIHRDPIRASTRGLLEYEDDVFGRKKFQYTTPPLQPSPSDLPLGLLMSTSFHLLARPEQVCEQVEGLLRLREKNGVGRRPLLVWEPAPLFCQSHLKTEHLEACRRVDVFSPNHIELAKLFQDAVLAQDGSLPPETIEAHAKAFIDSGIGHDGKGSIVVRAGEHGCLVVSSEGRHVWLPPFYGTTDRIVDATGAGNTFLGALTFALSHMGKDIFEAAKLATVAASFALEQIGLPIYSCDELGRELWNGVEVSGRIRHYQCKVEDEELEPRKKEK